MQDVDAWKLLHFVVDVCVALYFLILIMRLK